MNDKTIKFIAAGLVKTHENCVNRDSIKDLLGLDISKWKDAYKLVKDLGGETIFRPGDKEIYRLCWIGDDIIPIDDSIADLIFKLNNSGYYTKYCCSGHPWSPNGYILFKERYDIVPKVYKELTGAEKVEDTLFAKPSSTYSKVIRYVGLKGVNEDKADIISFGLSVKADQIDNSVQAINKVFLSFLN